MRGLCALTKFLPLTTTIRIAFRGPVVCRLVNYDF